MPITQQEFNTEISTARDPVIYLKSLEATPDEKIGFLYNCDSLPYDKLKSDQFIVFLQNLLNANQNLAGHLHALLYKHHSQLTSIDYRNFISAFLSFLKQIYSTFSFSEPRRSDDELQTQRQERNNILHFLLEIPTTITQEALEYICSEFKNRSLDAEDFIAIMLKEDGSLNLHDRFKIRLPLLHLLYETIIIAYRDARLSLDRFIAIRSQLFVPGRINHYCGDFNHFKIAVHINELTLSVILNPANEHDRDKLLANFMEENYLITKHFFLSAHSYYNIVTTDTLTRTRSFFDNFAKILPFMSFEQLTAFFNQETLLHIVDEPFLLALLREMEKKAGTPHNLEPFIKLLADHIEYRSEGTEDYSLLVLELITHHTLTDSQLVQLTHQKDKIKRQFEQLEYHAEEALLKSVFCASGDNFFSQTYLFFSLEQKAHQRDLQLHRELDSRSDYYDRPPAFRINYNHAKSNTESLQILQNMATRHPALILNLIITSQQNYHLYLFTDSKSKIKEAVRNYLIKEANLGRSEAIRILRSINNTETKLYKCMAIPRGTYYCEVELIQDDTTTSVKELRKAAERINPAESLTAASSSAAVLNPRQENKDYAALLRRQSNPIAYLRGLPIDPLEKVALLQQHAPSGYPFTISFLQDLLNANQTEDLALKISEFLSSANSFIDHVVTHNSGVVDRNYTYSYVNVHFLSLLKQLRATAPSTNESLNQTFSAFLKKQRFYQNVAQTLNHLCLEVGNGSLAVADFCCIINGYMDHLSPSSQMFQFPEMEEVYETISAAYQNGSLNIDDFIELKNKLFEKVCSASVNYHLDVALNINKLTLRVALNARTQEDRTALLGLHPSSSIKQSFMTQGAFLSAYFNLDLYRPTLNKAQSFFDNLANILPLLTPEQFDAFVKEKDFLSNITDEPFLLTLLKHINSRHDLIDKEAYINLIVTHIASRDSAKEDYSALVLELITHNKLTGSQLIQLTCQKNSIKKQLQTFEYNAEKQLVTSVFNLTETGNRSQVYEFFSLKQKSSQRALLSSVASSSAALFAIPAGVIKENSTSLKLMIKLATKHPALVLDLIINAPSDLQLHILKDSKIKEAVCDHLIAKAESREGLELFMINDKHSKIYRYMSQDGTTNSVRKLTEAVKRLKGHEIELVPVVSAQRMR